MIEKVQFRETSSKYYLSTSNFIFSEHDGCPCMDENVKIERLPELWNSSLLPRSLVKDMKQIKNVEQCGGVLGW